MKSNLPNSTDFEPKDTARIESLVLKSKGDNTKAIQLATNMANTIAKADKALRRGRAAEDLNCHAIAKIFFDRATELGMPPSALVIQAAQPKTVPPADLKIEVKSVSFRPKEKYSAKPRIYFWNDSKGKLVDMFMQRYTPKQVFTPHLDTVLRPLGMKLAGRGVASGERFGGTTYVKVSWSQFAGCSCPCSPGFVVNNPDYEFDIHVNYEIVKEEAAKRRA